MTVIQDLPEEILSLIFSALDVYDILQCQEVCQAWYLPAHLMRLANVELYDVSEIDRFIAAIDNNPNPLYLGAVKRVFIGTLFENHDDYQLDINKMLFRFRNLTEVKFRGQHYLTKPFNDQVCKNLLKSCPRLQTFEMNSYDFGAMQFKALYSVRLLLTLLSIDEEIVNNFKSTPQIIMMFPRLQALMCRCDYTFEELVPVFEVANDITFLSLDTRHKKEDCPQRYFESKTKEQQAEIMQRLAKIKHLSLNGGFSVDLVLFISKYLVGLQSFRLFNNFFRYISQEAVWDTLQEDTFCNEILDLVCLTKGNSYVALPIGLDSLTRCFPTITHKVFHNTSFKKALYICSKNNRREPCGLIELRVGSYNLQREQSVSITNNGGINLEDIATSLFTRTDEKFFVDFLSLDLGDSSGVIYPNSIDKVLKKVDALKEMYLSIPSCFTERKPTEEIVCPRVEKVTIQSATKARYQLLLDRYASMFPNIKYLNLYSLSGGESQVDLTNYSLKNLAIDVTSTNLKPSSERQYEFCVIQINTKSERLIYKVFISTLAATRIEKTDLVTLKFGEDYYKIDIIVANLQRLEVLLQGSEGDEDYLADHPRANYKKRAIINLKK